MKVLVIPDVHLKPWMFGQATALMKKGAADLALCLMDIADDWKQQYNLDLYEQSYDAAISFAEGFPDTLWCYGNHDICYEWNQRETGYSPVAARLVCEKLRKLREAVPDEKQVAFIHRIDNVLFLHGGLRDGYVRHYVSSEDYDDIDAVVLLQKQPPGIFKALPVYQIIRIASVVGGGKKARTQGALYRMADERKLHFLFLRKKLSWM